MTGSEAQKLVFLVVKNEKQWKKGPLAKVARDFVARRALLFLRVKSKKSVECFVSFLLHFLRICVINVLRFKRLTYLFQEHGFVLFQMKFVVDKGVN